MPKIREYNNTQTINSQPLDQAAYRVERTGMIEGQAIRQIGEEGAGALNTMEKNQAQSETSDLAKQMGDLDLSLTQQYEAAKQKGDPNNPTFATDFVSKNIDPALDKMGENISTRQGQQMYQEASNRLRLEYTKRGLADQVAFSGEKAVNNFKDTITSYANSVTTDPTTTDHAADMIALMAPSLPAEHRDALVSSGQELVYGAGAKAYLDSAIKNPNATSATLDQAWQYLADPKNGFVGHVNPDTFSALNKQYETAKETLGAATSALADQNWGDLKDRAMNNGGYDVGGSMQSLIDGYKGKNAAETQVWKAEHQKDLDETIAYGQASSGVRTMAQPDILAKYADLNNQINTAAPDKIGGLLAQQKAIVSASQQRDKEFSADPAAYVIGNSPVVQQRYQAYASNPTPASFARYAQTSLAEQARLYPDATPKLVTAEMEKSVGAQIASIAQTPDGASQVATTLSQYSQMMGPYWNRAAQEMFHDKVLNQAQYVAGTMWSKPEAQGLAQDLLRASTIPTKDLGIGGVTSAAADKEAASQLTPLRTALGSDANGYQVYAAYEKSLATLIQYKGDVSGAADMANKLIMDEYQFSGKLMMPANVDKSSAVAGTRSVQADLGNAQRHNLVVPPSYSGAGPADQRAEFTRDVQQSGYWIMSSDNKSAMLVTERGDPVRETVKGKVQNVTLDWATLQKLGGR